MNQDELLQAWYQAKQRQIEAVETERNLRLLVAEEVFGYDPDELPTGTLRHPLPEGFKAKMTFKVNENLDQSEIGAVREELAEMQVPQAMVLALFKPKYSLVKAIYKELTKDAQELVAMITTKTSATPTLEIESPKASKGKRK